MTRYDKKAAFLALCVIVLVLIIMTAGCGSDGSDMPKVIDKQAKQNEHGTVDYILWISTGNQVQVGPTLFDSCDIGDDFVRHQCAKQ